MAENPIFEEIIKKVEKYDPHVAKCILSSMEGVSESINRELTEDEKLIAYSMYMSGAIAERYSTMIRDIEHAKISLN